MDKKLPDIPIDVPHGLTERIQKATDPLAGIPTEVTQYPDIFNYAPPKDEDAMVSAGMRLPASWLAIIDEFRQAGGTPFPNLFGVRSDFFRWAVWNGMRQTAEFWQELKATADEDVADLDPMIEAHMFTERIQGLMQARADIVVKTGRTVEKTSNAIEILINSGEVVEAAKMIDLYIESAASMSDEFWRAFFINALFQDNYLRVQLVSMMNNNHIHNEVLMAVAIEAGLMQPRPERDDEY